MTTASVISDVSQSNPTTRRIAAFRKQFGEGHFYLACHAALPMALSPDLLYCLWANFQRDINGRLLDIPWIAVGDLLLSGLCETVGYELYEMEVAIQKELMLHLQHDPRFGQERIRELADFVMDYVTQQLESPDLDTRDFAQAQNWRAGAYKNPEKTAYSIASVLTQLSLGDSTEWIRMFALLETLAEPLSDYPSLLTYASAMADFVRGNEVQAAAKFGQILDITNQLHVAGINLPVPAKMVPAHSESVTLLKPNWVFVIDFVRQYYRWLFIGSVTACSLVGIGFYIHQSQQPTVNIASSSTPSPSPTPSVSLPPPTPSPLPSPSPSPTPSISPLPPSPSPSLSPSVSALPPASSPSIPSDSSPIAPTQSSPQFSTRPPSESLPSGSSTGTRSAGTSNSFSTNLLQSFGNSSTTANSSPSTPGSATTSTTPTTAEDFYQRAVQRYGQQNMQGAIEDFNESIKLNPNYAAAYFGRGTVYYEQGSFQEALKDLQQALALMQASGDRLGEASTLNKLALLYRAQGRFSEAEPLFQQALKIYQTALGATHPNVASVLVNLALLYQAQGRFSEAEPLFQQALKIYQTALGATHPEVAQVLSNLGSTYQAIGQYQQALNYYQQALTIQPALGATHPEVAQVLSSLGSTYQAIGQYQQALNYYQQALTIQQEIGDLLGEATVLTNMGIAYDSLGQYVQAIEFSQQALELHQTVGDIQGEANVRSMLGGVYASQGNKQKAIEYLQQAADLYQQQGQRQKYQDMLNRIDLLRR